MPPVRPAEPSPRTVALILSLTLLAAVLLRAVRLDLPGPQGDEVYMPYVAEQMLLHEPIGQPSLWILGRQWPLTVGPYTGAPPVYLYLVLMSVWQPLLLFRYVNIAYALASILLLYVLARELLGSPRAGLIAAALLAVLPASVFYSRMGEFDSFVRVPLLLLLLILFHRFLVTGRSSYLCGACFALGLGINIRGEMVWFVPVLVIWAILVPRARSQGEVSRRGARSVASTIACGALSFLAGTVPFSIYAARELPSVATYIGRNVVVSTAGADNRAVVANMLVRLGQLIGLLDGRATREIHCGVGDWAAGAVLVGALVWACLWVARGLATRKPTHPRPMLLASIAVVVVESTVTLSLLKAWHIVVLLPLVLLVVADSLDRAVTWKRALGVVLLAVVGISAMVSTARVYIKLHRNPPGSFLSPGIYSLVARLRSAGVRHVVTGDWGLARQVLVLSGGTVRTREVLVYDGGNTPPAWYREAVDSETGAGKTWVFYCDPLGEPRLHEAFRELVAGMGRHFSREVVRDNHGPLYEIDRFE